MGSDYINAGQISGVFGVKGSVKVFSHTDPRENIVHYSPWLLEKNGQTRLVDVISGQRQGLTVVASLEGVRDRDEALALIGWNILILRSQLPQPAPNEYYWLDLIGLKVQNQENVYLGIVDHLLETGANDVLVVKDGELERLIPFLQSITVLTIDLSAGVMIVDWDPDF